MGTLDHVIRPHPLRSLSLPDDAHPVVAAGPSDFRNASDPLVLRGSPGTIGLQIGDGGAPGVPTPPGFCTTVTVQDIYFGQSDVSLYTCAAPLAIIRSAALLRWL